MKIIIAGIRKSVAVALLTWLIACGAAAAQPTEDNRIKDELGVKRMSVIFPEADSEISDRTPMITVDFSKLEVPVDTESVAVLLNGVSVAADTEINPMYAMYRPAAALAPGEYEARVTAVNINRETIEPLSWRFKVVKGEMETVVPGGAERDNTTGYLIVSTDYVAAEYAPLTTVDLSRRFREKEGMKVNTDFYFANTSEGRTLTGAIHRETLSYSDTEVDKFRLFYRDANFQANAGNFWVGWSDLTMLGGELAGASIEKQYGSLRMQAVSGRTQDPSTSGAFKQVTTGARADYKWGAHTTSLMALRAHELDNPALSQFSAPAKDSILSLMHEYAPGDNLNVKLELGANARRPKDAASSRNQAFRLDVAAANNRGAGEIELYKIDQNYLPVSEGSAKYLKTDREGYRGMGNYSVSNRFSVGGEYEQYDTISTDVTNKRGRGWATLIKNGNILNYHFSKMTTTSGIETTASTLTANLKIGDAGLITKSRLTLAWMDIGYSATGVDNGTTRYQFSFGSSIAERLGVTCSYSLGDTDNSIMGATERQRIGGIGLLWDVIPGALTWTGRYEMVSRKSALISDNEETRLKLGVRHVIDSSYTLSLNWESVDYSDSILPKYDYKQNIWRTGAEWYF